MVVHKKIHVRQAVVFERKDSLVKVVPDETGATVKIKNKIRFTQEYYEIKVNGKVIWQLNEQAYQLLIAALLEYELNETVALINRLEPYEEGYIHDIIDRNMKRVHAEKQRKRVPEDFERRKNLIHEYFDTTLSIAAFSKRHSIKPTTFASWLRLYELPPKETVNKHVKRIMRALPYRDNLLCENEDGKLCRRIERDYHNSNKIGYWRASLISLHTMLSMMILF